MPPFLCPSPLPSRPSSQLRGTWDAFATASDGGAVQQLKLNLTIVTPDGLHGEVHVLRDGKYAPSEVWAVAFAQGSNATGRLIAVEAEHAYDAAAGEVAPPPILCAFHLAGLGPSAAVTVPEEGTEDGSELEWGSGGDAAAQLADICVWSFHAEAPARGGRAMTTFSLAVYSLAVPPSVAATHISGGDGSAAAGLVSLGGGRPRLVLVRSVSATKREDAAKTLFQKYGHFGGVAVLLAFQIGFKTWMKDRRLTGPGLFKDKLRARRELRDANIAAADAAQGVVDREEAAVGEGEGGSDAAAASEGKKDK